MSNIRVYVSLGSNIERQLHIHYGLRQLTRAFTTIIVSSIYESPAQGFKGPAFYNMVVGFDTELTITELKSKLHHIELSCGRNAETQSFVSRTLDIDILLYGDLIEYCRDYEIPRSDIVKYDFVLCPLAEVAGQAYHPQLKLSYADLWHSFNKKTSTLKKKSDLNAEIGAMC